MSEERVEPVKYRFAEGGRNVFHEECDCSADAIALGLRLQDGLFHLGTGVCVRAADRGCFNLVKCERVQVGHGSIDSADGRNPREEFRACNSLQERFCDGACGDAADGLAGRASAAATVITESVLEIVAEVCVPRSVPFGNIGIVLAVLVFVKYDERDGRAGCFAFENAGKDLYRIFFVTRGREFPLARAPAIQFCLNHFFGDCETGGASVEDGSDSRTMGFTPCSDRKNLSKRA